MWVTHHLLLRLRLSGAIFLLPLICLHGGDRDRFTTFLFFKKLVELFGKCLVNQRDSVETFLYFFYLLKDKFHLFVSHSCT